MKKIFSLFAIFMMLLVMTPVSVNNTVYAAEEKEENKKPQGTEVAFGALVKNNSSDENTTVYSSLYALKQSKYKSAYPDSNDVAPTYYTDRVPASGGLCSAENHYNNWSVVKDTLCNDNEMNSIVASFSLDDLSNLTITLQNDFTVNRLNIYYIVAGITENNDSSTSLIMCKGKTSNEICSRASYISNFDYSLAGNWQSTDKRDHQMSYTELTLEAAGFDVNTTSSGKRIYSGYNVIDEMNPGSRNLAYKVGAYVLITMSVDYTYYVEEVKDGILQDVKHVETYYINTPVTTKKKFTSVDVGGSGNEYTYSNVHNNPIDSTAEGVTIYNERLAELGGKVDNFAALTSKTQESTGASLDRFYKMFDEILKPVIIIALGLLLVIKGTSLIMTIIKSSDEPEVRRDSIKHLVTLFVSVFVIMMIIWFMKDIIEIISDIISGDA